jgi:hypothetical protein
MAWLARDTRSLPLADGSILPVRLTLPRCWNTTADVHAANQSTDAWSGSMPRVKCCSRKRSTEDNERRNSEVVPTERRACKCSKGQLRQRANAFTLRATGPSSMPPERGVASTRSTREELDLGLFREVRRNLQLIQHKRMYVICVNEAYHVWHECPPIARGWPRRNRLFQSFLYRVRRTASPRAKPT